MIPQPSLFDAPPSELDARFEEFHAAHPEVYETLKRIALDLRRRGWSRGAIGMLFEVARWEQLGDLEPDEDGWKLNNNWRASYARLLMAQEPELAGFFETRRLRS